MPIAKPYPWIKQVVTCNTSPTIHWELGAAVDEYDTVSEHYADGDSFPVWVISDARDAWVWGVGTLATGTPDTVLVSPFWTRQGFQISLTDDPGFVNSGTGTLTVGPGPVTPFFGGYAVSAMVIPTGVTETRVTWDTEHNGTGGTLGDVTGLVRKGVMVKLNGDPGDATEYTVYYNLAGFALSQTIPIADAMSYQSALFDGTLALPVVDIVHNGASSVTFDVQASSEMVLST